MAVTAYAGAGDEGSGFADWARKAYVSKPISVDEVRPNGAAALISTRASRQACSNLNFHASCTAKEPTFQ